MNVAITRAKELLVVVGNGTLLAQRDPYWKAFLQFTLRHKLFVTLPCCLATTYWFFRYVGPELKIDSDGSYISRLE